MYLQNGNNNNNYSSSNNNNINKIRFYKKGRDIYNTRPYVQRFSCYTQVIGKLANTFQTVCPGVLCFVRVLCVRVWTAGMEVALQHTNGSGGVISRSLSGIKGNSPSFSNAFKKMWDNGFLIAHAAGNEAIDACNYTPQKMDEVCYVNDLFSTKRSNALFFLMVSIYN